MHPLKKLNALLPLLGVSFNPRIEWRDREGAIRRLHMNDIQIMARLTTRRSPNLATELPRYRIGTVDKFQGQEAPVVIYSLTTSPPEDLETVDFLFKN
jgi:hypothetical protein